MAIGLQQNGTRQEPFPRESKDFVAPTVIWKLNIAVCIRTRETTVVWHFLDVFGRELSLNKIAMAQILTGQAALPERANTSIIEPNYCCGLL